MRLDRTNNSLFGRWWWTVDRPNLYALLFLIAVGSILVTAGSPPVAKRLGYSEFHFVTRHQIFLVIGLITMLATSMLPAIAIRRLSVLGLLVSVLFMVIVLFMGVETKGAHRWIALGGVSLQPSEFMKPFFAVVMAWVCSENQRRVDFPGYRVATIVYGVVVMLLLLQPDIGMAITVTAMWCIQLFLAGLPFLWVFLLIGLGVSGLMGAYFMFDHVARRINSFLDPQTGDNYQVEKSLEAFRSGAILGRGPGEGEVKQHLPDSHTDFIFAVAGEEFGVIACLVILGVFAFIVLRSLYCVREENDLFVVLGVAGIVTQFGVQAVINMGVAVNLLPAKGMTLPFLSYGGSSVIAIAIGMGMMLSFTRKRFGKQR